MPEVSHAPLRLAIVGCGAVTQANLIPVLAGHSGVTIVALVDRSRSRAQQLATSYVVARVETDMDAVLGDVDAVVLATPPAHHAPATQAAAARGRHVFVEKPMAITHADAASMVEAADRAGVVLSVGLYRRVLPSVRSWGALLASRQYGRLLSIDAEEGGPYGWQLASLDVLTKSAGGGGVLIDIGSHVLDVILHVAPGSATLDRYADNARGGIETDCELSFRIHQDGFDVPVRVELSRTRDLRGSIRAHCEHATLELMRGDFTQVLVHPGREQVHEVPPDVPVLPDVPVPARSIRLTASWSSQPEYLGYQAFRDEIDDWVNAIAERKEPMLSGRSVLPVVKLIEECYQQPSLIAEPWTDEGMQPVSAADSSPPATVTSPRRRVLITGAGGFLGGRTTELLREQYGWDVIPLVHAPRSAARLARWTSDIAIGDVCSATDMDTAMKGCDAVVHCAVGTIWPPEASRRVTVEGTRVAAEAARRAGVRRFVHISTLFVHRRDVTGTLDESTPLEPQATDDYGQAKLAAERALGDVARQGLSTVILRPVRIYGPFSRTFTIRPLQALAEDRFALSGDPDVPANMVYVDNVVEAIARAIDAGPEVGGSAYLVSDAEQVSLREFFGEFAAMGHHAVRFVPAASSANGAAPPPPGLAAQWVGGVKSILTSPELRAMVRRVISTDPICTLPRRWWEASETRQQKLLTKFGADAAVIYRPSAEAGQEDLVYYGEPARVSIAKAQSELRYVPPVSHARAVELTAAWARYARLLP